MSAITTIYLHGFTGNREGLRGVAESLDYEPYELWDLPGFGDDAPLPREAQLDIREYAKRVWADIDAAHPDKQFRLVGHSHGAMVAFTLTALEPSRVEELILLCPVSRPRWPVGVFTKLIQTAKRMLPGALFLGILRSRVIVDGTSHYMSSRKWTKAGRKRTFEIRRAESKQYSRQMIEMLDQPLSFNEHMKDERISVPTKMCYALDDSVAGKRDVDWYFDRCDVVTSVVSVHGGHLVVLAEPEYVAKSL